MAKKQINETLRQSNEQSHKFTRECICTALVYLMSTQDYDKITITSIINRSGVSRAAFYRNFSSKDEVLKTVIDHLWTEMNGIFTNPNFKENPREIIIDFFTTIDENSRAISLLAKTGFSIENFISDETREEIRSLYSIRDYYKQYILIHAFWALLTEWCQHGMQESPEELADILISTINIENL